ncbi:VapE domain-containing protein [uncultured Parabacteroides sp.]|uniref:VapE domain-containing protein n=1 Tax=uncultured Parabacteroides sp. TaxID=512312 RepID=UPI002593FFB8|nr:VapE domain-containing protein [uncultured Parabacteroides sp.]
MNAIKNLIEKLCDLVMHGRFSDETEVITNAVSEVMPVVATEELPEKHPAMMQEVSGVNNAGNVVPLAATDTPLQKATRAMMAMEQFLGEQYDLRFNKLTSETEFRKRNLSGACFQPVGQRELNSFCIEARKQGIDCWDRDVSRYVFSDSIPEYHPFRLYMDELPDWDGIDRIDSLARRVSSVPLWVKCFHRWLLGMAAQWLETDRLHANSVSPVLVSRTQGKQKSTFCKLLLPRELQRYYTDSYDLSAQSAAECKLTEFGLINMDEFDKFTPRKMALLKNLMQVVNPCVRKAHQKNYRPLPRVASFIATSNQKELLTDPTGSRRFLCVEIENKIDCSPLDYLQLYAQLKAELLAGERYWFTSEEEAEIMAANESYYKHPVEEDVFRSCFRPAEYGEKALMLSAAEIFQRLKKHNPAAMRSVSAGNFGKFLSSLGIERKHTESGNYYRVVALV